MSETKSEVNQELVIYEDGSIHLFITGDDLRKKWAIYKRVIDVFSGDTKP